MNSKLTMSEISDILAEKSGLSKKEAEQFLKDLFQQAAEVISSGESLTVNGIGRFKPVWVEPRGSVDVNTGEPIQIPGHYKISFAPDKSLRDAVNEPFASFTTEIIPADGDKIEDVNVTQVDVAYDTTESINAGTVEESSVSEPVKSDIEVVPVVLSEPNKADNEEKQIPVAAVQPVTVDVESVQEVKEEQKSTYNEDDDAFDYYTQLEYKRRTRNGYIAGFITALAIFLIIALGWYWVNRSKSSEYTLSFSPFKVTVGTHKIDTSKNKADSTVVVKKEVDKATDSSLKEPVVETIEPGKFLTTIAQKYYGNKIFWVYIYRENNKENKGSKIWNPRDLPRGFKVVVPEASKYGIDANNPESVKKAQELERQILYEIQ